MTVEETDTKNLENAKPGLRLYTPASVGVASFFGSVFCGLAMIALNYRAVGEKRSCGLIFATALATLPALFYFLTWP